MSLHNDVKNVESREDLTAFVERLKLDFEANPGGWENADLASFLGALAAWIEDMPGYFENHEEEVPVSPTWRLIGMILLASSSYE